MAASPLKRRRNALLTCAITVSLAGLVAVSESLAGGPTTKQAFQSFKMSATRPAVLDAAKLDTISDGMTLGGIVDKLGVGWMSPLEGAGIITWFFNDGRELRVWPGEYKSDEVITKKGESGRSGMWVEDTRRLTRAARPATTRP